eukprot:8130090-Pyramimonas_sp.AAC.1
MSDETKGGGAAEVAAAAAAEMKEMRLGNELRRRCKTGSKQTIPVRLLGPHPANRVGVFRNYSRVRSLAREIICVGPHQAGADFEGACVRGLPAEKQKYMAGYTSLTENCRGKAKGCLKEVCSRSDGEVLYGALSCAHLAITLRAIDAGAKWGTLTDDLAPSQVAMLQPMCEVGAGLLIMSAVADNDPAARKLVKEGVLHEALDPD